MSTVRKPRKPVSCEACRLRKIRCPRDGPPCGTCVRRGIYRQCVFADETVVRPNAPSTALPATPPQSTTASSPGTRTSQNLAERLEKLEHLVQTQWSPAKPGSMPTQTNTTSPTFAIETDVTTAPATLLGRLSTSNTGHVQFIPDARQWHPSLDQGTKAYIDGAVVSTTGPYPLGPDDPSALNELLQKLPPNPLCAELKDVYFSSFAPLFHMLHNPTFEKQYEAFELYPENISLSWLALLFAILGTAAIALDSNSPILNNLSRKSTFPDKIADLSARYRQAALDCLHADHYMWRHNVTTLQALLILIYGINHSHGQSWSLLGLASHIALAIGCHVEPSVFNLDVTESEERRRCWSCLMMLYTLQNAGLGNIGQRHDSLPSSTRPPADVNDDEIIPGFDVPTMSPERPTQMSYVLLKFRVYELYSDICQTVMSRTSSSIEQILHLDRAIADEQAMWHRKYNPNLRPAVIEAHQRLHLNILYSTSYHLTLLLHQNIWTNQAHGEPLREWSRKRVFDSARKLLDLHSDFVTSPSLGPFLWYVRGIGSFHAFHAAIVLFTFLRRESRKSVTDGEISRSLHRCLGVFESLSDVSRICSKTSPILRSLLSTLSLDSDFPGAMALPGNVVDGQQSYYGFQHLSLGPSSSPRTYNNLYGVQEETGSFENMYGQFNLQQWLTPSAMPWDDWDRIMEDFREVP